MCFARMQKKRNDWPIIIKKNIEDNKRNRERYIVKVFVSSISASMKMPSMPTKVEWELFWFIVSKRCSFNLTLKNFFAKICEKKLFYSRFYTAGVCVFFFFVSTSASIFKIWEKFCRKQFSSWINFMKGKRKYFLSSYFFFSNNFWLVCFILEPMFGCFILKIERLFVVSKCWTPTCLLRIWNERTNTGGCSCMHTIKQV